MRKAAVIGGIALLFLAAYILLTNEQLKTYPSTSVSSDHTWDVRLKNGDWYQTGIWVKPGDVVNIITEKPEMRQPFRVALGADTFQSFLIKDGNFAAMISATPAADNAKVDHANITKPEQLALKMVDEPRLDKLFLRVSIVR